MTKKAASNSTKSTKAASTKTVKSLKDAHAAEQRKTLMNWFIIIIMLGSVGIAMVSNSDGQKPTDTPQTPAPNLAPTIIPFAADNVDAKVEDLFGAFILTGTTAQPDLAKIDAQLTGIEGVVRVSSQFRSLEGTEGPQKLTYFAEVTYDNQRLTPPQLLQAIQTQASFLQEVVVYPIGLVSLPATVQLVNTDLNLTKDYRFTDPFAQAFLTVDTQKGDTIQVHINADLAGEQVRQMVVYESQNTGNAPQYVSLTGTYAIDALGKNLAVLGDFPYGSLAPD